MAFDRHIRTCMYVILNLLQALSACFLLVSFLKMPLQTYNAEDQL